MLRSATTLALLLLAGTPSCLALNGPSTSTPAADAGVIVDTSARGWIWHGMSVVDDPGFHGGSGYAGGSGTYAAYSFQGTSVAVYTMRGYAVTVDGRAHKMGSVKVKIDGQEKADVALNAGDSHFGYLAYTIGGLENKIHVVELDADGGWVAVDYLKVGAGVDAPDIGMGVRRAQDRGVKLVAELEVVVIAAAAGQQARVLAPPHRLPDRELPHG